MSLSNYSAVVREALLRVFPQFGGFVHVEQGVSHFEIRFPHPKAPHQLIISTENDEISIFLGSDHRHIGMCEELPVEQQIAEASGLISGILSGGVRLTTSSKWKGLWIDEDRGRGEHPDPDEQIRYTTWNELES
jgi:hypothetical protein